MAVPSHGSSITLEGVIVVEVEVVATATGHIDREWCSSVLIVEGFSLTSVCRSRIRGAADIKKHGCPQSQPRCERQRSRSRAPASERHGVQPHLIKPSLPHWLALGTWNLELGINDFVQKSMCTNPDRNIQTTAFTSILIMPLLICSWLTRVPTLYAPWS